MTSIQDAKKMLAKVRNYAKNDDESAHVEMDKLWLAVLTAVAQDSPDSKRLASIALECEGIEFARWYA